MLLTSISYNIYVGVLVGDWVSVLGCKQFLEEVAEGTYKKAIWDAMQEEFQEKGVQGIGKGNHPVKYK